ncbi:hypothetical protein [Escherichia marmotae]
MAEFTKEQLIEKLERRLAVTTHYPDFEEAQLDAQIFKIALEALTAGMEQADEIDELRRQVIRVPMPVVVPGEIISVFNVKAALARGIERYGDAMLELAKKEGK